ncbi:MAG: hypothetical protein ABEJ75_04195 [Candidatus Nanohaloarchaea archaeon]
MDTTNITSKIVYAVILGIGLLVVLGVYFSGLRTVAFKIQKVNTQDYPAVVVLENTLSVDATEEELSKTYREYQYDHRRAVIPVEFFTNRKNSPGEIGYKKKNGHCYIEKVAGLDGENFGIYIKPLYDVQKHTPNDPRELHCTTEKGDRSQTVFSEALLVRKAKHNPVLPARVYIYPIS